MQERVGLGEGRGGPKSLEDLVGVRQDGHGLGWSAELQETPSQAEESEPMLRDVPELLPTRGDHRV